MPLTRAVVKELAPTGEGVVVVTHEGERRAVFVRRVAAGDEVELDVDFRTRPAKARSSRLVVRGPEHAEAPCRVAETCGGCNFMHLTRIAQARWHEAHVRAALPEPSRGIAIDVSLAEQAERYRTRARLHAIASGGRARVGFFAAESHETVEVDECLVLEATLDRARGSVAALLEGAAGEGEARLAFGKLPERRPVLDVTWQRDLPAQVYARAEAAVAAGTWAGVRIACGEVTRPSIIGDPVPWITGADGEPLELSPGGFGQASEAMNAKLARAVAESVPEGSRVHELYAGAGNFTVLLARRAKKLSAVEFDLASCEAARRNLARRGLTATVTFADAAGHAIPAAVEVVVLDPPRAGAATACSALAKSSARRIVYVSCDTRTLARDLETLSPGYEIERVALFEMFPHTSHVETLVALKKRGRK